MAKKPTYEELAKKTQELMQIIAAKKSNHKISYQMFMKSPWAMSQTEIGTGKILDVNPKWLELHGYESREEIIGKTIDQIIHPDHLKTLEERRKKWGSSKWSDLPPVYETIDKTRDGSPIHVQVLKPMRSFKQGTLLTTIIDITERKKAKKALEESERRHRALFEASADGILIADAKTGKFNYANPAICRMLGYSEAALTKLGVEDIHPKKCLEYVLSEFEAQAKGEKTLAENIPCLRKNGTIIYADINTTTVVINGRKCNIGFFRDITDRKQAEEALRDSEERFRDLFDNAHDLIQSVNTDGKFVYVNKKWLQVLGYSTEELKKLRLTDIIRKDQIPHCMALFKRVCNGESIDTVKTVFLTKNGREVYVEGSVGPRFKDGKFHSTRSMFHDVTERKIAEAALKESEERFRVIANSALDAIVEIDPDGNITYWNPAAEKIFGYSKEEAIGKIVHNLIVPEQYRNNASQGFDSFKTDGTGAAIGKVLELKAIHKDGHEFPIEIAISPIKKQGKYWAAAIVRDITERKKAEKALLEMQKLESLGVLAGGIAHDFNNLLAGIMGNTSLAEMGIDDLLKNRGNKFLTGTEEINALKNQMQEILRASERATGLTRQLLTFAKGGIPSVKIADISKIIEESTIFILGQNSPCAYELALPDNLWPAKVDPHQISQVMQNLLINAIQAMPGGGVIRIGAENTQDPYGVGEGDFISISITDTGIGIPKKYLERIFDPYFTTKNHTGGGSGLGLAIVYRIIKEHNGRISVQSKPGQGTTFHIFLPAARRKIADDSIAPTVIEGSKIYKILIMDDEPMILRMLKRLLQKLGHQVEITTHGDEAIEMYSKALNSTKPFDLVILDLIIPGKMGGEETLKNLRNIKPNVVAIVSSGYANRLPAGFNANLPKPYNKKDVVDVIDKSMNPSN